MGVIYLITDTTNGMQYVGQTCNELEVRWRNHIGNAKDAIKIKNGEVLNFKPSYLYRAMADHGIENFKIEIITELEDKYLDEYEIAYIEEYNTLRPNGYNLTTGGGHFTHHPETIELMRQKAVAAAPGLIDKYRKEETKGLPMYIVSHCKGRARGFAINEHPLCKYKSFTLSNYPDMDSCKMAACKFLEELIANNVPYVANVKKNKELPTGITTFRNGYLVKRKINGIWYVKTYEGPDKIDCLEKAKKYLDEINNKV